MISPRKSPRTRDGTALRGIGRGDVVVRGPGAEPWTVRTYAPDDETTVLALHARAFGRPWSAGLWRWRTTDTPDRTPRACGAFDGAGNAVAIFAGVALDCRYRGEPGIAISGSNSVLDPALRQSLVGSRLFLRVVAEFFARFGGGPARLMYGSPVQPLVRAMASRCGVEVLSDLYTLVHDLEHVPLAPPSFLVQAGADLPPDVDELCRACADEQPDGVVRDARFLAWRFARHPCCDYRLVTARDPDGVLRGLMVLRTGGWRSDLTTIVEWLVRADDRDTEVALLAHAVHAARRAGSVRLVAVFAPSTVEHGRWQTAHRFCGHPTSHQLLFKSFSRGVNRDYLFDRWRITAADLEFL